MNKPIGLYRGEVFYFTASPLTCTKPYEYFADGALVVSGGKVIHAGPYESLSARYPSAEVFDYSGYLIMPGLIDSHIHYPQTEIIGMYGKQLLDWLDEYVFPTEQTFLSPEVAERVARLFVNELFRNGTTTCMAYASVYPGSVDTLFTVASEYNMQMLTGKILMDRNAPQALTDTAESGYSDSKLLIEKWHKAGRNRYVITPRFAITSTSDQLKSAARLHNEYPDTYIQTHLSENRAEVESIRALYPGCKDYLEVYECARLLTDRSVFGHSIHLSDSECQRMADSGAVIAHCPTSNQFLGSGLFDMQRANSYGIATTIATDVAGGTSFSMWRTMGEAYKVQQLNGYPVSALELLYKCTLGTAKALKLDDTTGSFEPGKAADFIVVDYASTPIQASRMNYLRQTGKDTIENKLFGLQTDGDDRAIVETYIMGESVYKHK